MSQHLIFTTERSNTYGGDLSPPTTPDRIIRTMKIVMVGKMILGNDEVSAKESTDSLFNDPSCPSYLVSKAISDYNPDMRVSRHCMLMLGGLCETPRHAEICAASLAWLTVLRRGKYVEISELMDLMPHGPPTAKFLNELDAYYQNHPDDLWPPQLIVEVK